MKIGTSTRTVGHLDLIQAMNFLKKVGYEEVEIWVEPPQLSLDTVSEEEIERIRKEKDILGLDVAVHAPIRDLNLSSLNHGSRKEALRQTKDAIVFARKIEAPIVIIHPGRNSSLKDPFEHTQERFYESMEEIVTTAQENNIIIAMENMEKRKGEYILTPEDMLEVKRRIPSDYLRFTFDIAHAHTHTNTEEIVNFYKAIADHVAHIHISDNKGFDSKTHMKMGEGHINFEAILTALLQNNFKGYLTIEGYQPLSAEKTVSENFVFLRNLLNKIQPST